MSQTTSIKTGYKGIVGEQDDSLIQIPNNLLASNVLTVGIGKEFSTIAAAVAAAKDGMTIEVDAGTYTNDFSTITHKITLIGVGGTVNMVATKPPTNLKGIITVDNSATIENFSFSGAAISDSDGGNGAGIRYEGGDLVLRNDTFHDNQNGLLAFPVLGLPTNTIVLDHDTFNKNGSGTGYTHNVYVGAVDSLTVTNSIFEQANVGHELKSRALVNTINNNSFYDGPTATASYDIDLPNGGVDVVQNNTIEKGAHAENNSMVHFSGEGIPYSGSSLIVQGNTFVDDKGSAIGVLNQSAINVTITGNTFNKMTSGAIASGPATETGNYNGSGQEFADTKLVGALPGNTQIYTDGLAHSITLVGGGIQAVEGGAGLLTVTAIAGHIIVIGGSGGMNYTEVAPSGGNQVTTAAHSTNTIVLAGQDTLDSEGNDTIWAGTGNITANVNGSSVITDGTETGQWSVNGTATIKAVNSNEFISLGSSGTVSVSGTEAYLQITNNGGTASFDVIQGGSEEKASFVGGSSSVKVYSNQMQVATGGGSQGVNMTFYAGTETVTSVGADTIHVGATNATIIVEGGAKVYAGTGKLSVFGRSDAAGASVYAANGTVTLDGDSGNISYYGGSQANTVQSILSSDRFYGGSGTMTINGGSRETIVGGSGGVVFNSNGGGANSVTTLAGSKNILKLSCQDVINSNGTDTITTTGTMSGKVTGNSTINGGSNDIALTLAGTETFTGYGHDMLTVATGAIVSVRVSGFSTVSETGATVSYYEEPAPIVTANAQLPIANVTVIGGSASIHSDSSSGLQVTTNAGQSTTVNMGSGAQKVTTLSNDQVHAGSGADSVVVCASGASVWAGSGNTSVSVCDWKSSDTTTVYGGTGTLSLTGGTDALKFIGGTGAAVVNGQYGSLQAIGGSGNLTIYGGCAPTTFVAGSGKANVTLNSTGGSVQFGTGTTTVNEAGWGDSTAIRNVIEPDHEQFV